MVWPPLQVSGLKEDAGVPANYWPARPGAIAMMKQRVPGCPSDYNEDIATTIFAIGSVDGESSLRHLCQWWDAQQGDGFPLDRQPRGAGEQYQWARELQADDILGRILEIADDSSRDYVQKTGPDGKVTWVEDRNHIANCQFRINALFRVVDRLAPKKHGRR